ncbi:MAG: N-acetylmuramic acid 6-phosphate etherase [Reichenbachiella sp.]|uniref:N-acetylmuramic acid 6-phosphate etherase n=1 Tax=Reichenbachiella sp. TaxID=2184521 RepID=UPI003262F6F0
MQNTTESTSNYNELEHMTVAELLGNINKEDQTVPQAVAKVIPKIEGLVIQIVAKMSEGGRLFYIGAGTSGRLGVVDASEIPPTYGLPHGHVVGVIAGGDGAIRKSVEHAEDDPNQAWQDLLAYDISDKDLLIGIAASGRTPYVIGGLAKANEAGLVTGCITCNQGSKLAETAQYPIEVVVGPEFVTGSTRMKAGTAQKLVLNMISTTVMIQLGHVQGNKMVDMQLSNEKLIDRAIRMVIEETGVSREKAQQLVESQGSVRKAIDHHKSSDA